MTPRNYKEKKNVLGSIQGEDKIYKTSIWSKRNVPSVFVNPQ